MYQATFKGTDIVFIKDDIFQEKGVILIKNAKNADDKNDKTIPRNLKLHEVEMPLETKLKIKDFFQKVTTEKTKSKSRAERQLRHI
jgi:hypothetical protein